MRIKKMVGVVCAALVSLSVSAQELPRTEAEIRELSSQVIMRMFGEALPVTVTARPVNGVYNVHAQWWMDNLLGAFGVVGFTAEEQWLRDNDPDALMMKAAPDIYRSMRSICEQLDLSEPVQLNKLRREKVRDVRFTIACVVRQSGMRVVYTNTAMLGPDNLGYISGVIHYGGVSRQTEALIAERAEQMRTVIRAMWAGKNAGKPMARLRTSQARVTQLTQELLDAANLFGSIENISSRVIRYGTRFGIPNPDGTGVSGSIALFAPMVEKSNEELIAEHKDSFRDMCEGRLTTNTDTADRPFQGLELKLIFNTVCTMREGEVHIHRVLIRNGAYIAVLNLEMPLPAHATNQMRQSADTLTGQLSSAFVRDFAPLLR